MRSETDRADDYCDKHMLQLRRDAGEADPDGRVKTADCEYASLLIINELLHDQAFVQHVGFDPDRVILTPTRARLILEALPRFAPFCCYLGRARRDRILRKSRHPPIEFEHNRRPSTTPVAAAEPDSPRQDIPERTPLPRTLAT